MSVSIKNVSHSFFTKSELHVLENVNIDIKGGEFISIVGPSGCGKSTLLNIICGLIKPIKGEVLINNEKITDLSRALKHNLGYMMQQDNLLPWKNAFENAAIGLKLKGVPKDEQEKIIRKWFHIVGLRGFEKAYPRELSGGMQKRVALVRTLAINPSIILMDEPFANLDFQTRLLIENDFIKFVKELKSTVIFVTHDLTEAIILSDRLALMTARPGTIKKIYTIDIRRDDIFKMRYSPEFSKLFEEVWSELSIEVLKSREAEIEEGKVEEKKRKIVVPPPEL